MIEVWAPGKKVGGALMVVDMRYNYLLSLCVAISYFRSL